jgi:hypothetical protein
LKRLALALTFFLGCVIACADPWSERQDIMFGALYGKQSNQVKFTDALFSPDGRALALNVDNHGLIAGTSDLSVASVDCLLGADPPETCFIGEFAGFVSSGTGRIVWSPDGQTIYVPDGGGAITRTAVMLGNSPKTYSRQLENGSSQGWNEDVEIFGLRETAIEIAITACRQRIGRHTDTNQRVLGERNCSRVAASGPEVSAALDGYSDGRIGPVILPGPAAAWNDAQLGWLASGDMVLIGTHGRALAIASKPPNAIREIAVPLFGKWIRDATSGAVVGSFGPTQAVFFSSHGRAVFSDFSLADLPGRGGGWIESISAHNGTRRLAIVYCFIDARCDLILRDGNGPFITVYQGPDQKKVRPRYRLETVDKRVVHFYDPDQPPLATVVFFHGGPSVSGAYGDSQDVISQYLVPEFAGASGIGEAAWAVLRTQGPAAIENDAKEICAIARSAAKESRSGKIWLHGESFGGMMAGSMIAQGCPAAGAVFLGPLLFTAPFMRGDESDWNSRWSRYMFGTDIAGRMAGWEGHLGQSRAAIRECGGCRLFVGDLDRLTPPEHFKDVFSSPQFTKLRGSHNLSNNQEAWAAIDVELAKILSNK